MLSSKPPSLSESCLSAIHHDHQPSCHSSMMPICHHTPPLASATMPIRHHFNQPAPSASQKSCPSAILPISHYANQQLCPPPSVIMPISYHAYQPPCTPPINYAYQQLSVAKATLELQMSVSLSVTNTLMPLRFMPISHYLHLPSINMHIAYQPSYQQPPRPISLSKS